MCPYAYYSKLNNYDKEVIICHKTNNICPFTRYCNNVNKIIPNDRIGYTMEDCKMRYEKEIPKGSSRIRKTVSDKRYIYADIEINGKLYTHKLKNPHPESEIPDYVFVEEGINGYEIVQENKKVGRSKNKI